MYIRVKKIKSSNYAYLVKSKRRKSKVKQKSLKYLGRVYKPLQCQLSSSNHLNADIYGFISNNSNSQILISLIRFELLSHQFKEIKHNIFSYEEIKADLNKLTFKNKSNNNVVLEINEGFLCNYTINSMLNYKFPNLDEKGCGISLANSLLNTGIKLNQELFILLFKKYYAEISSSI